MKNLFKLITGILILTSCQTNRYYVQTMKERTLSEVVQAIQDQYNKALTRLGPNNNVEIKKAELTVKLSDVKSTSGDITVLIIKPAGKHIQTKTTSVTYTLAQTDNKTQLKPDQMAANDELSSLIVDAATKFNKLNSKIGNLTKDGFSIDIVFSIENDKAASITFNIFGAGTNLSYENDKSIEHELVLEFGNKK